MKSLDEKIWTSKKEFLAKILALTCTIALTASCGTDKDKSSSASKSSSEANISKTAAVDEVEYQEISLSEPNQDAHSESHNANGSAYNESEPGTYDDAEEASEALDDTFYVEEIAVDRVAFASQQDQGYLTWEAPEQIDYVEAKLSIVAPNGERIERVFAPGEEIALVSSLPDGIYTWESVVTPELDPYAKDKMRSSRESGNIEEQERIKSQLRAEGYLPSEAEANANRQSGAFIVQDGIARPSTVDPIDLEGG